MTDEEEYLFYLKAKIREHFEDLRATQNPRIKAFIHGDIVRVAKATMDEQKGAPSVVWNE